MSFIYIKKKRDPIEVSAERARKVKQRWMGDDFAQIAKAEPHELVDLGDWCGEYGQIASIEITKEASAVSRETPFEREEREQRERWAKMSPEAKGEQIGWFKLAYSMRTGRFKEDPPAETLQKVIAVQTEYFREHPREERVPSALIEEFLPKKNPDAKSLVEKMSVPRETPPPEPNPDDIPF